MKWENKYSKKNQSKKSVKMDKYKVGPAENKQHQIFLADFQKYGNHQSGVYKGVLWEMKRPFNTYWCYYIKKNLDIGIIMKNGWMGFDCCGIQDYYPLKVGKNYYKLLLDKGDETFKTYDYIVSKIKDIIDEGFWG